MKKISIIISFCIITIMGRAQWLTNLNDGGPMPQFGIRTYNPLSFYTNNTLRMTLDADGKLGIGKADPAAALDVIGDGIFSGNLKFQNSLSFNDNFKIEYAPAASGGPATIGFKTWQSTTTPFKYIPLCNVFFTPPAQPAGTPPSSYVFTTQSANLFQNLVQISDQTTSNTAAMSFGIMNGSGIIAVEPLPFFPNTGNEALKLNPGCKMDVNICEGGGYTRIFAGAGVLGNLTVDNGATIINGSNSSAIIVNNGPQQSNCFNVQSNGQTFIKGHVGIGSQPVSNTIFNVYDPAAAQGSVLFSTGSTYAPNAFSIDYRGVTTINAGVASSPAAPVFKVRNANADIFEIATDGTTYARDVIVTLNNFPDYVFSKGYTLMPIEEVKNFIQKNQRLPNMPAAKDIENNGARLGELQRLTVEKVEELYLYILQLEEKVAELNKKVEQTQKKN